MPAALSPSTTHAAASLRTELSLHLGRGRRLVRTPKVPPAELGRKCEDQTVEGKADQGDGEQPRKDQRRVEELLSVKYAEAQPALGGDHLGAEQNDPRDRHAEPRAGEDVRQRCR